jgi:REP element-mobilizing transposase RayT
MQKVEPIEYGYYYHIYNRGINGTDLFWSDDNYSYFMELYFKYIDLVADTYAWCLMKNHFHFLVRIKEEGEIQPFKPLSGYKTSERVNGLLTPSAVLHPDGGLVKRRKPKPSNQFSHLFNSYAQAYNRMYNRTGSLFEKPFKRKLVESEDYLKRLVFYIHHNPVHHGIADRITEYTWSSYLTIIKPSEMKIKREEVIDWFDDVENFKFYHQQEHEFDAMKDLLIDS